jgi:hypothetical protein
MKKPGSIYGLLWSSCPGAGPIDDGGVASLQTQFTKSATWLSPHLRPVQLPPAERTFSCTHATSKVSFTVQDVMSVVWQVLLFGK